MTDPYPAEAFLSIADFTEEFPGTLTTGQTVTATRLLQVVSDRIRTLKPDVADDDPAAIQVAFEVVRDAVLYGALEKFSSFQNITSRRQESGTFDASAKVVDDYLTTRHKRILGVLTSAGPRGSFRKGDY